MRLLRYALNDEPFYFHPSRCFPTGQDNWAWAIPWLIPFAF